MEAYHHVYDKRERDRLAEVVVSLVAARPRLSPNDGYFTASYAGECECLTAHGRLLQELLQFQLFREREYSEKIGQRETAGVATASLTKPSPLYGACGVCAL